MYVYLSDADGYQVGFYDPESKWIIESYHETDMSSASRVHYLNGGVDAEVVGLIFSHVCDLLMDIYSKLSCLDRIATALESSLDQ